MSEISSLALKKRKIPKNENVKCSLVHVHVAITHNDVTLT